jgi:hypothetical protein
MPGNTSDLGKSKMRIALILALLALLAPIGQVYACSCAEPLLPREAAEKAAAVFIGIVTSHELVTRQDSPLGEPRRRYQLTATEVFKGEVGATVDVYTGLGGGDCGYTFEVGQKYLVYTYGTPPKLNTNICSRTKIITLPSQEQEEINELRDYVEPSKPMKRDNAEGA